MQTLFDLPPVYPPGFTYEPGFISPSEEAGLIAAIAGLALIPFEFKGYTARRNTASFGYDYSFSKGRLRQGKPIPEAFHPLIEKVAARMGISPYEIAELLVTEYPPGAVINWHRNAPPFGVIAGISLGADCIFRFRPHDPQLQTRRNIRSLTLEARSLYIMAGESRDKWQHSISPVTQSRYSITLRTLRDTGGTSFSAQ